MGPIHDPTDLKVDKASLKFWPTSKELKCWMLDITYSI